MPNIADDGANMMMVHMHILNRSGLSSIIPLVPRIVLTPSFLKSSKSNMAAKALDLNI